MGRSDTPFVVSIRGRTRTFQIGELWKWALARMRTRSNARQIRGARLVGCREGAAHTHARFGLDLLNPKLKSRDKSTALAVNAICAEPHRAVRARMIIIRARTGGSVKGHSRTDRICRGRTRT